MERILRMSIREYACRQDTQQVLCRRLKQAVIREQEKIVHILYNYVQWHIGSHLYDTRPLNYY